MKIKLYQFQEDGLTAAEGKNRIAYYWEMGTGKTYVGAEKLKRLGAKINLIVCQKSKVNDWLEHFIAVLGLGFTSMGLVFGVKKHKIRKVERKELEEARRRLLIS